MNPWRLSNRADRDCLPLADRHYNRQKIGSPQFVPPGRCCVLKAGDPVGAFGSNGVTMKRKRQRPDPVRRYKRCLGIDVPPDVKFPKRHDRMAAKMLAEITDLVHREPSGRFLRVTNHAGSVQHFVLVESRKPEVQS